MKPVKLFLLVIVLLLQFNETDICICYLTFYCAARVFLSRFMFSSSFNLKLCPRVSVEQFDCFFLLLL